MTSPMTNPPAVGFFAGANDVDANQGIFVDVAGGHNRIQIIQHNHMSPTPELSAVLNKLQRAKDAGYQFSIHETCLDGTRTAELQHIGDWEVDYTTKQVYWVRGIPGSGKSTIAKTFAVRSSTAGRLGASFFCSRDFQDRRNIRLIFPTLAYYLALHSPEFKAAMIPIIEENPDVSLETLDFQFNKLIVQPLQSTGIYVTIIIDALDECEDDRPASAILSVLDRYIKSIPYAKFFITGRPEQQIRTGFRLPTLRQNTELFLLHEVERVSVNQDIELYLRTSLSEIVAQRSHWDLTVPWPTDEDIMITVEKCFGLFIAASVIVKFVSSMDHEPEEQLQIMISSPDGISHEGRLKIDGPYHQVLLQGLEDIDADDTKSLAHLRIVIGSIVVAFNPLSCASLATILGVKIARVWSALRPLHSIFIVPDSKSEPIRVCHKSLADYLTDNTRCTDARFYIDPSVLHLELAFRCLRLMNASLKKNICELPRYAMNADIADLDGRREKYIGGGLKYGCRSWAMHLRLASRGDVKHIVEGLKEFFDHHLLAWFEVLSIIGDLRSAAYSFRDVKAWLNDSISPDVDLLAIVEDSERFLLLFFDGIEASAIHIYDSALPLSPSSSLVRKIYKDQMSTDVKIISGLDDFWFPYIRTVTIRDSVGCMVFSHKDDLIAVGEYRCVEIFETVTGQRRARLPTNNEVRALTFSPDDTILVTGISDGRAQIWDLQTGALVGTLEGHTKGICSVEFSPDGSMVATSSEDHTIRIWNTSSLDCHCVLQGHLDYVLTICWSATGTEVISGSSDTTVKVWSVSTKTCSNTLTHHTAFVNAVASLPDSPLIASGCAKGKVFIFNAETGGILHTMMGEWKAIKFVRFLDREKVMYAFMKTYEGSCMFAIRDLTKSTDVLTSNYEGHHVAISSDGTRLASSFGVNNVRIWPTNSTNHYQTKAGHHAGEVSRISSSMDGRLVVSGSSDKTLKIWDSSTGRCLTTYHGLSVRPGWILFSPDSTSCASRGDDDIIKIWDVHSGRTFSTLVLGENMCRLQDGCFSPSGRQLVSLMTDYGKNPPGSRVILSEVMTGDCLASMEIEFWIKEVSFNIDGTSVVLKLYNNTQTWRISPSPSHKSNATNMSSLPMVFIPRQDTEAFTRPDKRRRDTHITNLYQGWIADRRQEHRWMLWVPHEMRRRNDVIEKKAVFGSDSGVVTFVDFSEVVDQ